MSSGLLREARNCARRSRGRSRGLVICGAASRGQLVFCFGSGIFRGIVICGAFLSLPSVFLRRTQTPGYSSNFDFLRFEPQGNASPIVVTSTSPFLYKATSLIPGSFKQFSQMICRE